ncbi:MAG TPA: MBL fold metallo-hydrolase [Actinomycetota bacterium]|nr:MBL fold metallo-hydrolase [Actinomycetota bacterium]
MTAPVLIDTKMHGHDGLTAAHLIRGSEKTALIETGPKSYVENVFAGLEAAGVEQIDWIFVTHIHLDHAGAAGTLAQRYPEARIGVHEIGAPHLVDPSKLWSSASRIYGDAMEQLWGGVDPLPVERIEVIEDGDVFGLGGITLTAVETPGHASHHHSFLSDEGDLFAGDAIGVRLPDIGVIRPTSPPPEFDIETAVGSIERLRALEPTTLWPTHYGPHDQGARPLGVSEFCDEAIDAIHTWADWVRDARRHSTDLDDVTERVRAAASAALEDTLSPAARAKMEQTSSYRMNTMGYMRYLAKTEGVAAQE